VAVGRTMGNHRAFSLLHRLCMHLAVTPVQDGDGVSPPRQSTLQGNVPVAQGAAAVASLRVQPARPSGGATALRLPAGPRRRTPMFRPAGPRPSLDFVWPDATG
jgi:hypothetical protein